MVLFLFVVMLLGAEQAEGGQDRIGWQRPLAIGLAVALLGLAVTVALRTAGVTAAQNDPSFGAPEQIGAVLFTTYLLPFEITGVILLIAVIGVVVLNQRRKTQN
jgi:NADH-quinone oxidoreductase subunit J